MNSIKTPLLNSINSPKDLKLIKKVDLHKVCDELRDFIIDIVSEHGGHFGASLGVVELTVALHYVFDTPNDLLVWDVGHQAYGHKILTGRRDIFHTNRKYKGISGFPNRFESNYDTFGVGHSSTSVGAALGMAVASNLDSNDTRQHVAIIGDGALTGGQAFEALNHAGIENSNILVILNDNCMSIDPNVGALKEYLLKISKSKTYNKIREEVWDLLSKLSSFGDSAKTVVQKVEQALKSVMLKQSNYFESLNFRYFGPIDGHDTIQLINTLNDLKEIPGPKILHCLTTKGKGYKLAEKDQTKWHAPGLFDKDSGKINVANKKNSQLTKYQDVFGKTIVELAKKNKKIVGITPAMPSGSSLKFMMKEMPNRAFDVGIAEQHAVTFSAGLATQGLIPYCNIYSTFLQRGYDQLIHDVAIQNLHVVFCLDRAGLVGEDGATHQGVFDLAYLRCIPNLIIASPMNEIELRNLMYTAQLKQHSPFAIRYPRGTGVLTDWEVPFEEIEIGKGNVISEGSDIAVISIGHIGNMINNIVTEIQENKINIGHYDIRFLKPLDEKLLHIIFQKYKYIITIEDGCLKGGLSSAILEFSNDNNYKNNIFRFGVPDQFIEHGSLQEQRIECGYDKNSVLKKIQEIINNL
ncbi:MAG: 1-deoxy-D-xylulose-5-phosphate synthase [Flavobacteriales bacterium]|nr:1-deoxy-D-xylulose-5-phosphate synthase [Flavobacteriales bacterium]